MQSSAEQVNATYLNYTMHAYIASSAAPITDCLAETGLSSGATCTYANNCQSCTQVPACGGPNRANFQSVFYATGGVYGAFAAGIMQFEAQYANLTANLTRYYAAVGTLKNSPTQQDINTIQSSFSAISSLTSVMGENPIFPPPQSADFSQCASGGSGTGNVITSGNWYCNAVGFCSFLSYNDTLLNNLQSRVNELSSLPLTSAQIDAVAANVSSNEYVYVEPILTKQKLVQVNAMLNTTLVGYNNVTADAAGLLTHLSSAELSADLARVEANYTRLTTDYATSNLIALNKTLAFQYSTLKSSYAALNATYASILSLSENNTAMLLNLQSDNNNPSGQLTALSFQEAELNNQANGNISSATKLQERLQSVNQQAAQLPGSADLPQAMARAIAAPLATALLSGSPYSNAVANAPLYSLILPAIIGIAALLLLFRFYKGLSKQHRLASTRRTSRNWMMLFAAAIVVVLLFLLAAYNVASGANKGAPITSFNSAVRGAGTVIVAVNGTSNPSLSACATRVASALTAQHKQVKRITMSGASCNNGMPLETVDKCLSYYASNNMPVIIFTNSSSSSISAYSYFGSTLSVSGNQQFMDSCIASLVVR